ncbi:MAG: serine hydrolase [Helicobacteraceae bacterium]|nr:serine hydrolase [Helicobacteraceae bacterium]
MKTLFLTLLIGLNLFGGVESFEDFVREETTAQTPPSASFAVLKGDKILYESSFGFNDSKASQATSLESIYHVFSLTKILSATLVMQLVNEGVLGLEDPVEKYLPRFRAKYEGKEVTVTILNLLNHSSGITDRSSEVRPLTDDDYYAYAKASGLETAKYVELPYLPGSEANYSSAEYIILSRIIEKATGEGFGEMVMERVVGPAQMKRSGFTYTDAMAADQVYGTMKMFSITGIAMRMFMDSANKDHWDGTTEWLKQFDIGWLAAGGLVAPIHDMALFLSAYNNHLLMDEKTKKMFLETPTVKVDSFLSSQEDVRFGIGWYHIKDKGEFFYQHQGLGPGFRTMIRIYPKYDISFVILTSQTETDIDAWGDRLIKDVKGGLF